MECFIEGREHNGQKMLAIAEEKYGKQNKL
jgi:hypothetical protein